MKFGEIAKEIGISANNVSKRFVEMKKKGIIVGATTEINYEHLGYHALAEIFLSDCQQNIAVTREYLKNINKGLPVIDDPKVPIGLSTTEIQENGCFAVFTIMKNLEDLEHLKMKLGKYHFRKMNSYIWTSRIRNIPENLSFGFDKKVGEKARRPRQAIVRANKKTFEIDDIDRKIIEKLSLNGRIPFSKIAEEVGVTTDTVARRYINLEKTGTIRTLIQINPSKVGYSGTLNSYIRLKFQRDSIAMMNALSEIPDIFTMVGTSGNYDLHVWALIRDIEHFLKIKKTIVCLPDFGKIDYQIDKIYLDKYPGPRHYITTV